MEKLYTRIIGTPIYEDDSTRPFTTVQDIILDPEQGKLLALVVNIAQNLIVAPIDILAWGDVIRVHSHSVIVKADEIIRIQEVQKNQIHFFKNRVETESGKVLGKIYDFVIDNKTFILQKIFVGKSILGLFRYDTRIIPSKNIIEMTPKKIIVKDDQETIKEQSKAEVSMEDLAVS